MKTKLNNPPPRDRSRHEFSSPCDRSRHKTSSIMGVPSKELNIAENPQSLGSELRRKIKDVKPPP